MNKKIYPLIILLFFTSLFCTFATQITKVGVIDKAKILQTFYKESQVYRELESMKTDLQNQMIKLNDEIKMYEERKLKAEDRGDASEALNLDKIIFEKKLYMQDFYRTKNNQLTEKQKNISQNREFAKELIDVITFIALSQGCSIVIDKATPGLMYYNEEVDITNMVLERLQSFN